MTLLRACFFWARVDLILSSHLLAGILYVPLPLFTVCHFDDVIVWNLLLHHRQYVRSSLSLAFAPNATR
jgi:hypothetical protein